MHKAIIIDPASQRQPEEAWYLENESDSDAVDRYLQRCRRLREERADYAEWLPVGLGKESFDLSPGERYKLQNQCHKLYFLNPVAGGILDVYSFYTNGAEGLKVNWENPTAQEWWNMLAERNKFDKLGKDVVTLTYTTGETFLVLFPLLNGAENERPKLDFIEVHPTKITDVKCDENDMRVVKSYERRPPSGEKIEYVAEDVVHFKIRDLGNVPRGRPIIERIIKALALYDDWLMSRMDLNRMRSRLPVIRYRSGLRSSGLPIKSLPEPNTVIDAHKDSEEWKFPSLTLDSTDAQKDGDALKQYISAGVNLPQYMIFGEGTTSEALDSIPLLLFKNFQGIFKDFFTELIKKAMPVEYEAGPPTITFPDVDLIRFEEKVQYVLDEFEAGIRSKRSAQLALELNPEEEEEWIEKEFGLTQEEINNLPEGILRKLTSAILFHAPAIQSGRMKGHNFLEKMTKLFDKRGWIKAE